MRFHGAFTGGFSAGYFNTVGSKEGKHFNSAYFNIKSRLRDFKNCPKYHLDSFNHMVCQGSGSCLFPFAVISLVFVYF